MMGNKSIHGPKTLVHGEIVDGDITTLKKEADSSVLMIDWYQNTNCFLFRFLKNENLEDASKIYRTDTQVQQELLGYLKDRCVFLSALELPLGGKVIYCTAVSKNPNDGKELRKKLAKREEIVDVDMREPKKQIKTCELFSKYPAK